MPKSLARTNCFPARMILQLQRFARCLPRAKRILRVLSLREDPSLWSKRHFPSTIAQLAFATVWSKGWFAFLGLSDGPIEVLALKPDGKKSMDARAFAAGIQGIKAGGCTWERIDG